MDSVEILIRDPNGTELLVGQWQMPDARLLLFQNDETGSGSPHDAPLLCLRISRLIDELKQFAILRPEQEDPADQGTESGAGDDDNNGIAPWDIAAKVGDVNLPDSEIWDIRDALAVVALNQSLLCILRLQDQAQCEKLSLLRESLLETDEMSWLKIEDDWEFDAQAELQWHASQLIKALNEMSSSREWMIEERPEGAGSITLIDFLDNEEEYRPIRFLDIDDDEPYSRAVRNMAVEMVSLLRPDTDGVSFLHGMADVFSLVHRILVAAYASECHQEEPENMQANCATLVAEIACAALDSTKPITSQLKPLTLALVAVLALVECSNDPNIGANFVMEVIQTILDRIPLPLLKPIAHSGVWFLENRPSLRDSPVQATLVRTLKQFRHFGVVFDDGDDWYLEEKVHCRCSGKVDFSKPSDWLV